MMWEAKIKGYFYLRERGLKRLLLSNQFHLLWCCVSKNDVTAAVFWWKGKYVWNFVQLITSVTWFPLARGIWNLIRFIIFGLNKTTKALNIYIYGYVRTRKAVYHFLFMQAAVASNTPLRIILVYFILFSFSFIYLLSYGKQNVVQTAFYSTSIKLIKTSINIPLTLSNITGLSVSIATFGTNIHFFFLGLKW